MAGDYVADVAWWCARCKTPHRYGTPEQGCPDCGYHTEDVEP